MIRLCAIPTYFAPTSVQQKSQLRRPIGTTRSARSRWLVSIGTSGSARYVQRIAAERLACECVQAVEGFAHVDRTTIDMDADGAFGEEHQPRDK